MIHCKVYDVHHIDSVTKFMLSTVLFLQIQLSDDFDITRGECACPRGKFKCHHMAALIVYGREKVSRTDVPCQWKVC